MRNDTALSYLYNSLESQQAALDFVKMSNDPSILLDLPMFQSEIDYTKKTIQCIEEGLPLLHCWYFHGPEFFVAMGLHYYCIVSPTFSGFLAFVDPNLQVHLAQETDKLALPSDTCSLHRHMLNAAVSGKAPIPTVSISGVIPCNGISLFHEAVRQIDGWRDVPVFFPDAPYLDNDDAIDYHVCQLRQMVKFVEEHTGKKMDIDYLKEVIAESNKHYELWLDINEMRRMKPCPHRSFHGYALWSMVQNNPLTIGQKETSQYLETVLIDAENKVKKKIGRVKEEKIRILWFDVVPHYCPVYFLINVVTS